MLTDPNTAPKRSRTMWLASTAGSGMRRGMEERNSSSNTRNVTTPAAAGGGGICARAQCRGGKGGGKGWRV